MNGDQTLFASEAQVEAQWRVVDGVLRRSEDPIAYAPGTWGPLSERVMPPGGWHDPS